MKIAIVVHGRFHAFHLARELLRCGEDVLLLTNYPAVIVGKFGIPRANCRSFISHGLMARLAQRFLKINAVEKWLHQSFSRWAAAVLKKEKWDAVYVFSGVAAEVFESLQVLSTVKILVRGSSHIVTQAKILTEEEKRTGCKLEKPAPWLIEREQKEYAAADMIMVLSQFARESFLQNGVSVGKLNVLSLGVENKKFRSGFETIEERQKRILSGDKLRVLMTGTFSFRKGAVDFAQIVKNLSGRFQFRFVGAVADECKALQKELAGNVEWISKQSEFKLPAFYDWADVFIFTTLEDGYAAVLSQAQAAGLPILATVHCAAPDFIQNGVNGWILPVRSSESFIERLNKCDGNRQETADLAGRAYQAFKPREWADMAKDLETWLKKKISG